jgi:hypothetical protein
VRAAGHHPRERGDREVAGAVAGSVDEAQLGTRSGRAALRISKQRLESVNIVCRTVMKLYGER